MDCSESQDNTTCRCLFYVSREDSNPEKDYRGTIELRRVRENEEAPRGELEEDRGGC